MQYKNLFECEYPKIEKELVWKKHPNFEVEVSNYGHFRNIGNDSPINKTNRTVVRLVYEAFNGVILPDYTNIILANFNPYDTRVENLVLNVEGKSRKIAEKAFVKATVDEMIKREPFISQFMDPEEYFKQLQMPKKFMTEWKKRNNPELRKYKKGSYSHS